MDATPNLDLPYIAPQQAQKHVAVNESFRRLDAIVQLAVVSRTTAAQPASPADGERYILPAGKTGAQWGAMSNLAVACYVDGAWLQLTPREGFAAWVADADEFVLYDGAAWSELAGGGGGDALVAYPLSQFAATTSAQLASVISDETGAGALVFGTAPTIAGGSITALTTFSLRDTSAAFDLTFAAISSTALTADRTLTLDVVNAARTIRLAGNIDVAASFTTAGANALTFTTTGATNVALPTTGTLATLAGAETLSGKTLTTPAINGGTIAARVQTSPETTGALTSASANKTVACTGGVTLPNSVFAAGDIILFEPGASERTFTRGAGIAMYLAGADAASASLGANKMGMAYWRSASAVVLSGGFA